MDYHWDWNWIWTYRASILEATWVTIWINIIVIILGTTLGTLLAILREISGTALRIGVGIFVDTFRSLPILVLLIWSFYCVPILLGGIRVSPYVAAILVLALNLAAFTSEIVRSGISSIPKSHLEYGRVCGLSKRQSMAKIMIPIAFRIVIPPLTGQFINTIKLSVLASIISVPELLHKTNDIISQTYRPLEFYTMLAVIFLLLLLPLTVWSRRIEKRTQHMIKEGL